MKQPKTYNRIFVRLVQSITQELSFGAQKESWLPVGQLYGYFQPMRATEELAYAMRLVSTDTKVRIQGYLSKLQLVDRLQDKETGDTYYIDGILQDKMQNELVVMCHRQQEQGTESPA
jgi:hypothetical protein